MSQIAAFMSERHRLCDQIFADTENLISAKDWMNGEKKFSSFCQELNGHLAMEEDILFPALDDKMGGPCGPTEVMRSEHEQMRELLQELTEAIQTQNKDTFLGCSETLMMLIQQHNMKEERMLYPMTDKLLADEAEDLVNQMKILK